MNPIQDRPYCSKGVFGYLYLALAGLSAVPGFGLLAANLAEGKKLSLLDYDAFRCTEDQLLLLMAGIPFALAAFVLLVVLVYKIWAALPPESARTTPGKAVGFLFIPLFNFYWYFVALFGWTEDFRRYAREQNFPGPRPSPSVAVAIGVLNLFATPIGIAAGFAEVPLAGSVAGLPLAILLVVFAFQACAAVNALPAEAVQAARAARDARRRRHPAHRQGSGQPGARDPEPPAALPGRHPGHRRHRAGGQAAQAVQDRRLHGRADPEHLRHGVLRPVYSGRDYRDRHRGVTQPTPPRQYRQASAAGAKCRSTVYSS